MMLDFTLKQYEALCRAVIDSGHGAMTVAGYLQAAGAGVDLVVLRHDVDRFPESALRMAQLEYRLGLCSTYYFRHTSNVFKPFIIRQIAEMGHEIGYHYETLSKARGDAPQAFKLFEQELKDFRSITAVRTICMHGSPLSPYDNRDLWKMYDFRNLDLLGEAYLSIDYRRLQYFTDTGRTWKRTIFNLRDHTEQMLPEESAASTPDLISVINQKRYPQVCISAHPERWANNLAAWGFSFGFDLLSNQAKAGIRQFSRKN